MSVTVAADESRRSFLSGVIPVINTTRVQTMNLCLTSISVPLILVLLVDWQVAGSLVTVP